jgi:cation diffusion facilitator CzcD-associated flavoprotein CzcO
MIATQLLVVGAGPYALSMAGLARERGIDTLVIGTPMGFWRQNMPQGMFLRSGPGWHLDAAGVATFRAFLEERSIAAEDVDPIPLGVFLDYTDWFRQTKGIEVHEDLVTALLRCCRSSVPGPACRRFAAVVRGIELARRTRRGPGRVSAPRR